MIDCVHVQKIIKSGGIWGLPVEVGSTEISGKFSRSKTSEWHRWNSDSVVFKGELRKRKQRLEWTGPDLRRRPWAGNSPSMWLRWTQTFTKNRKQSLSVAQMTSDIHREQEALPQCGSDGLRHPLWAGSSPSVWLRWPQTSTISKKQSLSVARVDSSHFCLHSRAKISRQNGSSSSADRGFSDSKERDLHTGSVPCLGRHRAL